MKQEWSTEKFTSGFAAAISSIPAGRLRLTPPNFMKKAAACSRVRAGIYSPVGTAHLIPLRKAGRLYLHPMNFSGIIEMDEIPAIQELLKDAKSFCCYGFDCYERYWDITDEEYLAQLETKREEITHEILERCRTKRKNLYITGPVALNVAQKFSVHRLCDKEGKHNLANRFVGELMEQLVQDGLLVTTKTRNGPGVRTATDAEISSPLPGQQQMTL